MSTNDSQVKFDYLVFGATGFTGKFVCKELLRKAESWKIAFAGRSREKLLSLFSWLGLDEPLHENVGLIVADVQDKASLVNMCKRSKIVLDCVGPFKHWGEEVVMACLEGGSDYIDITGEPEYISRIMNKYHDVAASKGSYILPACGFDCIPSELGMVYAKKEFNGTLTAVENYFTLKYGAKGIKLNFGTYSSLVNSVSDVTLAKGIRPITYKRGAGLPFVGPKLKVTKFQRYQDKYAIPFIGTDIAVVKGSQDYYYKKFKEIPVQFSMYSVVSLAETVALAVFFFVLGILTRFKWGVELLLKYPAIFSGGLFDKTGPCEEQMNTCGFQFNLYCSGYRDQASCDEIKNGKYPDDPPQAHMRVRVCGPEIAYVTTPITMVQAAICLMEERRKFPATGGVFLPGPAFRDTTLIELLQRNGITFEVIN